MTAAMALGRAAATLLVTAALAACSSASVGSVGAVFGRDRDTGALHVRQAPEGLPAREAGLLPGDRIKMIDGVHVDDVNEARVRQLLRGEIGTTVRLTVIRGEEVLHVDVVRRAMRTAEPLPPQEERIE
jgi:C-terminal processing protease CtpA/Prc